MKRDLQLVDADDGDFWMAFHDFVKYFDSIHICLTKKYVKTNKFPIRCYKNHFISDHPDKTFLNPKINELYFVENC
jgi:hypothetical protein